MRWIVRASRALAAAAVFAVLSASSLGAQGVTTASVRGRVADQAGAPVEGASVLLTNTSTGQRYQTTSRARGLYSVENVAVGGPYTIDARRIGHRPVTRTGIYLSLGQVLEADLVLERAAVEVEGVTVVAEEQDRVMSADVQGTRLTVSDSILRRLPTLDREFQDFVRLTPQVAERDEGGVSAAGQNNRYNTIQVDGSTVNDRFGLGRTGLTGGQAGGKAVGLEAVKEYQVLLAPYDVRQGNFTGALINAVTKSGTNDFHGTAFYYFRNQELAGDPLSKTDFNQRQFGASLGGPIRRDRAHFFVNAELRRRSTPARGPYVGQADPIRASQADIDAFNTALAGYGLPTGTGELITNENPLDNFLGRVDYRVSDRSRLVFRYIYNAAQDDIFSRFASGTFDLSTVGYHFTNSTHNPSVQFFTNFAGGASNELLFSLNRIRDKREPNVTTPLIIVQNFSGADGTGFYSLQSGSERFSQGNELDQDIWEITDNVTIPMNNHRITIGTRNEIYKVRNLFAQSSYGVWTFDNLANFQSGTVEQYESAGDLGKGIAATFTAAIFGLYAQDQWQVSPRVTITAGLRVDRPTFFTKPTFDPRVAADGFSTEVPSGQLMFAPRIGFNVDLGERTTQIRGGIGLFTGTPAYVWYSNAYSNNGTKIGRVTCTGTNVPAFSTQLGGPLECADGTGIAAGTTIGEVNVIADDTKFPQVLRGNLAIDRRLPGDVVATAEVLFTKGVNDFLIVNRNLVEPAATNVDQHGRLMYGTINANGTVTPNYLDLTLYGPSFNGGVYELRNTSNNWSWSITTQFQKRFANHWEATLGYTYADAEDVQSFTSSRAISNWRFGRPYAGSQLADDATTSAFARPHRLVAGLTYSAPWRSAPTDISLSYTAQSGQPYTLIASGSSGRGDLNADGNQNDPIYLPRDVASEMTFLAIGVRTPAQQAAQFEEYLAGETCLSRQRGRIMERNSCRNPAQHFLNLTVRQSLPQFARGNVSLELGIFNLLNLLNKDWGQIRTVNQIVFNEYSILTLVDAGGPGGTPRYQLAYNPATQERFQKTSSTLNSYQIQMALRYGF
jgi:outer membrane receptor for ferrienterochelin and colicin